jgi:hypothetical protein
MTPLNLIAGNTPTLQRLLEAGGITSVEELSRQEPGALAERLAEVTRARGVATALSAGDTARLIGLARKVLDSQAAGARAETATGVPMALDQVPEAIVVNAPKPAPAPAPASPSGKPAAIPLRPAAVPVAAPVRTAAAKVSSGGSRERGGESAGQPEPAKKFRGFDEYASGQTGVAPLPRKPTEDEGEVAESLKRFNYQPGEPIPRMVRRGVPHPRPFFLVFCSLVVLVWRLLTMAVILGTPIVLWPAFAQGDTTHLITFLWVIGAWLLSGLFYLLFALRARCRVCTNQIFWSKRCFKNQKAHRVPGLGLVGSLALHALLFGWFRCMYCGTAIRLKFVADPERSK